MRRSIATVSLSGTLPEKLEAIAHAGFDGIELFEHDLLCYSGTPADVRKMAEDLGLGIFLFQPFRDFEGVTPARLVRNLERARHKFDLMHALGVDRMLVCSNVAADSSTEDSLIVDQLGLLALLAQRHGVTVGYEALAWGRHVRGYQHAWRLVDAVGLNALGLVLDSFHTLALDDSLDALAGIPGHRIAYVQIADAPRLAMDVIEWSRHFRCFPGQGELPVADFLAPVIANGYDGPLSLEVFNDDFRSSASRATAEDGLRSLIYLEESIREKLVGRAAAATDALALSSVLMGRYGVVPEQLAVHEGVAFLEFAVDLAGYERLGRLLTGLGFRFAGRHRSKQVFLYRQGRTNIVLNAEPDSFASHFFESHGVSLCAIAFQVDDADLAFARAIAYGYRACPGKTGPNECVIPAVQAPDGSLVYFVDDRAGRPSIYESDFILEYGGGVADADEARVDHLSLAMAPDAMDAWVLFYRAVFGFRVAAPVTVPDPYGLIRSRALCSAGEAVRIVLNTSESDNTTIGRALSTYGGVGMHHLAIEVADLPEAVRRLGALGTRMLAIPRNYYEDLAARVDLADDDVAQLAACDILYDRDADGGELLHAYIGQLEGRFFVEILERRGAYAGYGAANAAVRLAAHAQAQTSADGEKRVANL